MPAPKAMAKLYPEKDPPLDPHAENRPGGGLTQLELKVPEAPRKTLEHIYGVYAAMQRAVDKFGGIVAFAASMGKGHGEVGRRVRREEDQHGDMQRGFVDYIGVLGTDPQAREVFLFGLCDLWGYKHPDFRNAPTAQEKLDSLLATLDGEAGEAVKERAARMGGFHPRSFGK